MSESEIRKNWAENLTGLPGYLEGNLRGIQGTGNEMVAVARALKHGFIVFFKAWPDTNYDLVIDHGGILFRVEVKGSRGTSLNLTRGQRRGKQIDPNAPSRERKVSRTDCDIVIGVDANNGDCYILPIDYAEHCLGKNPTFKSIERFRERWDFIHGNKMLDTESCRRGLWAYSKKDLLEICRGVHSVESLNASSQLRLMAVAYENAPKK